jgi:hypothetical protein
VGDDGEADEGYKAKDYSRKESEATWEEARAAVLVPAVFLLVGTKITDWSIWAVQFSIWHFLGR